MKLGIVIGSHRRSSNSRSVGDLLEEMSADLGAFTSHFVLDLGAHPLQLWTEDVYDETSVIARSFAPISQHLEGCDAFVVITPEWSGMATPAIRNFLLMCQRYELSHRPTLLVSVSSGYPKSAPLNELRGSGYKNTRMLYIPENLVIGDVASFLNGTSTHYATTVARCRYALSLLGEYARSLSHFDRNIINHAEFPFGM